MVHARSLVLPSIALAALVSLAACRADTSAVFAEDEGVCEAVYVEDASSGNGHKEIGAPDKGEGGRFVVVMLPGVPWGNSTPISDGHGSWVSLAPDGAIDVSSSAQTLPNPQDLPQRIVCKGQRSGRVVFRGERVGTAQCGDLGHAAGVGIWTAGDGASRSSVGDESVTCGPEDDGQSSSSGDDSPHPHSP